MTRRQLFAAFAGLLASLFVPKRKQRGKWINVVSPDGQIVKVRDANQTVRLTKMDRGPPRLLAGREAEMMDLRGRIYLHGVRVYRKPCNA